MVRRLAPLLLSACAACSWALPDNIPCTTANDCPQGAQCDSTSHHCVNNGNVDCQGNGQPCNGRCLQTFNDVQNCGACGAACDADGGTPYCNNNQCVLIRTPQNFKLTVAVASVTLHWDLDPNAQEFIVYRGPAGGTLAPIQTINGNNATSYGDSTVTAGTNYDYAVSLRSFNNLDSGQTARLTAYVPFAPPPDASFKVTATPTTAHLTWAAVTGATDYHLTRIADTGEPALVTDTVSTSVDDTTLLPATSYTWTIAARNHGNAGRPSSQAVIWSVIDPAITPTDPGFTLSWGNQPLSFFTAFDVFDSADGQTFAHLLGPVFVQTNDTTAHPEGRYYQLVATSRYLSATRSSHVVQVPAAPQASVNGNPDGTAHLSWPAVAAATSYTVQGGGISGTRTVTGLSTDDAAPNGNAYTVRALIGTTASAGAHVTLPPTPGAVTAQGDTTIAVSWQPVTGADSYLLFIAQDAGAFSAVPVAGLSYSQTGALPASTYSYKLEVVAGSGHSLPGPATMLAAQPVVTALVGTHATVYGDAYQVTVTPDPNVSGYYYQRSDDGGASWNTLLSGPPGYGTPPGPVGALYRMAAYGADGASLRMSVPILPPQPPPTVSATQGASNTVTWPEVAGATGYVVLRSAIGADPVPAFLANVSPRSGTVSYSDSAPLTPASFYSVQTVKGVATSFPSVEASAPPANFVLGSRQTGSFGSLVLGDLNGDGKPDFATTGVSEVYWYFGAGNGSFDSGHMLSIFPTDLGEAQLLDLGGINRPSLIAPSHGYTVGTGIPPGQILVFNNDGNGNFQGGPATYAGPATSIAAIADANHDGLEDVFYTYNWQNQTSSLGYALNTGGGSLTTGATLGGPVNPYFLTAGDFNGDRNLDLAVSDASASKVWIFNALGNNPTSFTTSTSPYDIVSGDLNNDGKLDLVVGFPSLGKVTVYLGNGNNTFGAGTDVTVGSQPHRLALGDLDGDGKLDLAVANNGGHLGVLYGNGDGTFKPMIQLYAPNAEAVRIADVDGDGRPDLVVTPLAVYLNSGPRSTCATCSTDVDCAPGLSCLNGRCQPVGIIGSTAGVVSPTKGTLVAHYGPGVYWGASAASPPVGYNPFQGQVLTRTGGHLRAGGDPAPDLCQSSGHYDLGSFDLTGKQVRIECGTDAAHIKDSANASLFGAAFTSGAKGTVGAAGSPGWGMLAATGDGNGRTGQYSCGVSTSNAGGGIGYCTGAGGGTLANHIASYSTDKTGAAAVGCGGTGCTGPTCKYHVWVWVK